ncbi:2-oxoacid dehydrogenase subunit E1 [Bordetella trematum]|nr:2-oxoacid dehydrogenase subunit E1 [Bordetella trematum]
MNPPLVLPDVDPQETREWLEALEAVVAAEGRPRAHYLIDQLTDFDAQRHGDLHGRVTTAYVNTIGRAHQPAYPGDLALEARLNAYIRWNAMVMVLRAGKHSNVGGHIATYQSAAVLYDVGFNHFFRGRTERYGGDMVYIQGTRRRVSTAVPTSKGALPTPSWIISGVKPGAMACLPIPIPG